MAKLDERFKRGELPEDEYQRLTADLFAPGGGYMVQSHLDDLRR